MNNDLAKRMKENYEQRCEHYLIRRMPVAIRLDGKAFHSFTKGFKRPFDDILMHTMQQTMKYLCENIQGCVLGYHQSDEITLILVDYKELDSQAWFDYKQSKIDSISASMATFIFNKLFNEAISKYKAYYSEEDYDTYLCSEDEIPYVKSLFKSAERGAMFDSRSFNIPKEEVINLILWRQQDATRNSINMVGQHYFSHKELQGKTTDEIQDMLYLQHGINWSDYPIYQKRGSCCIRVEDVIVANDGSKCVRHKWVVDNFIPIFSGDGREYIDKLINF